MPRSAKAANGVESDMVTARRASATRDCFADSVLLFNPFSLRRPQSRRRPSLVRNGEEDEVVDVDVSRAGTTTSREPCLFLKDDEKTQRCKATEDVVVDATCIGVVICIA